MPTANLQSETSVALANIRSVSGSCKLVSVHPKKYCHCVMQKWPLLEIVWNIKNIEIWILSKLPGSAFWKVLEIVWNIQNTQILMGGEGTLNVHNYKFISPISFIITSKFLPMSVNIWWRKFYMGKENFRSAVKVTLIEFWRIELIMSTKQKVCCQ